MPRSINVNVPEVSPNVSQGSPFLQIQATPEEFGAGIGRAVERGGEQSLRTSDVLAQNALRIQENTNEAAARDTFNRASEAYRAKSLTDGIYSKKPAQLYGEGQTPFDVYKNAKNDYEAAGKEFADQLKNPRAQLLFNKAWGEHGNVELGRASSFAASSHKEYIGEGIKAFEQGHQQTVADLSTNVEKDWRNLPGAESAAANNIKVGLRLGMGPDEAAKLARTSADALRTSAIRGWFNEQTDLDRAATQLTMGKVDDPQAQAILDKIDPKQREALTSHLLESRHKLAVINNANRLEKERGERHVAESTIQSIFLDPKLSTTDRQAQLDTLRGNIHVPIETLRKADDFIRDGGRSAAINVESDNLNVELAIRSDVIKTDNDLINYIAGASPDGTTHAPLQVSTEMMRTRLLPMVTSKRDKAFTDIVDAGMKELGFYKSETNGAMSISPEKLERALKFASDMTYYRIDHPDADFRSVARGMIDTAHKATSTAASASVPELMTAYKAAIKSGNVSDIATKKTALGAVMEQAGIVDPLTRAGSSFDPITTLDEYLKKKAQ